MRFLLEKYMNVVTCALQRQCQQKEDAQTCGKNWNALFFIRNLPPDANKVAKSYRVQRDIKSAEWRNL
jgi:hypothetical protein